MSRKGQPGIPNLWGNVRKIDHHWPLRNPLLFHGRILQYGYYHWTPHNTLLVYGGNARSGVVMGPACKFVPLLQLERRGRYIRDCFPSPRQLQNHTSASLGITSNTHSSPSFEKVLFQDNSVLRIFVNMKSSVLTLIFYNALALALAAPSPDTGKIPPGPRSPFPFPLTRPLNTGIQAFMSTSSKKNPISNRLNRVRTG
jgi:hypothetical protein